MYTTFVCVPCPLLHLLLMTDSGVNGLIYQHLVSSLIKVVVMLFSGHRAIDLLIEDLVVWLYCMIGILYWN